MTEQCLPKLYIEFMSYDSLYIVPPLLIPKEFPEYFSNADLVVKSEMTTLEPLPGTSLNLAF